MSTRDTSLTVFARRIYDSACSRAHVPARSYQPSFIVHGSVRLGYRQQDEQTYHFDATFMEHSQGERRPVHYSEMGRCSFGEFNAQEACSHGLTRITHALETLQANESLHVGFVVDEQKSRISIQVPPPVSPERGKELFAHMRAALD